MPLKHIKTKEGPARSEDPSTPTTGNPLAVANPVLYHPDTEGKGHHLISLLSTDLSKRVSGMDAWQGPTPLTPRGNPSSDHAWLAPGTQGQGFVLLGPEEERP